MRSVEGTGAAGWHDSVRSIRPGVYIRQVEGRRDGSDCAMSALPFGMRGIQNEKVEDDSGSIVLKLTCMKDER